MFVFFFYLIYSSLKHFFSYKMWTCITRNVQSENICCKWVHAGLNLSQVESDRTWCLLSKKPASLSQYCNINLTALWYQKALLSFFWLFGCCCPLVLVSGSGVFCLSPVSPHSGWFLMFVLSPTFTWIMEPSGKVWDELHCRAKTIISKMVGKNIWGGIKIRKTH